MATRRTNHGYSAYWRPEANAWYYSVHLDGRRRRGRIPETIPRHDRKRASDAAARIYADALRGRGPAAPPRATPPPDPASITLAQLLDHDATRPGIRPATRQLALEKGARLRDHFGDDRPVASITAGDIDAYTAARAPVVAPRTVNLELSLLAAAWRRAHDDAFLPPPPRIRKLPGTRHTPTILSPEELTRLLAAAREFDVANRRRRLSPRLEHILVMLANTGLRRAELFRLRWRAIDLERDSLTVLTSKRGSAGDYRTRLVPINAAARLALTERRDELLHHRGPDALLPDAPVWGSYNTASGAPASGVLYRRLKRIAAAAGIDRPVRLHDLRHSFAMIAFGNDLDVVTVSRILGHTSPRTTMDIYLHDRADLARDTINRLAIGRVPPPPSEIT